MNNNNKYTIKYINKRKSEGWVRRSLFGPADIVEKIVNDFQVKMLKWKLNKTKKEQ